MRTSSIEAIVRALEDARVRYLIVGGLAVAAHGVVRSIADVDLVLDPEPAALRRALDALARLGYRPRAPVELGEFADPAKRAAWVRWNHLTIFPLLSPEHPATGIMLFAELPFDFEAACATAVRLEVAPGLAATCVDRARLIEMKRQAGRPEDLEDVQRLSEMHGNAGEAAPED